VIESILSALLAPSVMVTHTLMVLGMILGRSVKWGNQTRETDGTSWGEAFSYHAPATTLGVFWSIIAWKIEPEFFYWMSPILAGLLLSAPISVWTSRSRYGLTLLKGKILATSDELFPPEIIRLTDECSAAVDSSLSATFPMREGIIAAVVDPYVNGVHVSLLEPAENDVEDFVSKLLAHGCDILGKKEMTELMYNSSAMLAMHRSVWSLPFDQLHVTWSNAVESYRLKLSELV
jgi:membrane glycosyltransferase